EPHAGDGRRPAAGHRRAAGLPAHAARVIRRLLPRYQGTTVLTHSRFCRYGGDTLEGPGAALSRVQGVVSTRRLGRMWRTPPSSRSRTLRRSMATISPSSG